MLAQDHAEHPLQKTVQYQNQRPPDRHHAGLGVVSFTVQQVLPSASVYQARDRTPFAGMDCRGRRRVAMVAATHAKTAQRRSASGHEEQDEKQRSGGKDERERKAKEEE